jgi:hypothetical protein
MSARQMRRRLAQVEEKMSSKHDGTARKSEVSRLDVPHRMSSRALHFIFGSPSPIVLF